jgi:hypothetical protein
VANKGDRWLSRDIGGKGGRCVTNKGDRWLSREMGG